jgi:transcriptional repressor NrdR
MSLFHPHSSAGSAGNNFLKKRVSWCIMKLIIQLEGEFSLKCPYCGYEESKVIDSRPTEEGSAIRRRRECLECQHRFTTYEKIEAISLVVIKKDNSRQPYNRDKVLGGIMTACEQRPISTAQMEKLVDDIEGELYQSMRREIPSSEIGEKVMQRLRKLDEVAYVRFASVYKRFDDIHTFMQELNNLIKEK